MKVNGMEWAMGLVKEECEVYNIKTKPGGPEKECNEKELLNYLTITSKHNIRLSVFNNKAAAD